jgi:hypothetical protein
MAAVLGRRSTALSKAFTFVAVCAVAVLTQGATAFGHAGHSHHDGRIPGHPDFRRIGDTTYRFDPDRELYVSDRPGVPPSYAHVDYSSPDGAGAGSGQAVASNGAEVLLPSHELPPVCRNTGNRIVVVYTHRPNEAAATPTAQIRSIVRRMNWKISTAAAQSSGGQRSLQMAVECEASGIRVRNVATAGKGPDVIDYTLRSQLGEPTGTDAVKYLVFESSKHPDFFGIGYTYQDNSKSYNNWNAKTTATAIVYGPGVWENQTPVHELLHVFGAAQGVASPPAPYSTPGYHCTDGMDVLCYNDESLPANQFSNARCPASAGYETPATVPIDCGNDTYFNAKPPAGSWLANYWNVAGTENRFLVGYADTQELGFVRFNHASGSTELVTYGAPGYNVLASNGLTGYPALAESKYVQAIAIDWNGDGIDELGFVNFKAATSSTELVTYAGAPNYNVLASACGTGYPKITDPQNVRAIAIDWNGDGKDELGFVRYNHSSGKAELVTYTGAPCYNTLASIGKTGYPSTSDPKYLEALAIDWTGDGIDELGFVNFKPASGNTDLVTYVGAPNYNLLASVASTGYPPITEPQNVQALAIDTTGDGIDELGFVNFKPASGNTDLVTYVGAPQYNVPALIGPTGYPAITDPQNVQALAIDWNN